MSHKENLKVVFMRGSLSIQVAISQCLIDEVTIQSTTTHVYRQCSKFKSLLSQLIVGLPKCKYDY